MRCLPYSVLQKNNLNVIKWANFSLTRYIVSLFSPQKTYHIVKLVLRGAGFSSHQLGGGSDKERLRLLSFGSLILRDVQCTQILLPSHLSPLGEALVQDNIWFTFKARIQAHKRLEWLDLHSQCLLVWYAVLSSVLGIITIRFPQALGENTDIYAAILAVALLSVSLAVANRDFRGRALQMRANYLALQSLYREITASNCVSSQNIAKYEELLADCENHETIDDRIARCFATNLQTRIPTKLDQFHTWFWLVSRAVVTMALYATPIIAAAIAWKIR